MTHILFFMNIDYVIYTDGSFFLDGNVPIILLCTFIIFHAPN